MDFLFGEGGLGMNKQGGFVSADVRSGLQGLGWTSSNTFTHEIHTRRMPRFANPRFEHPRFANPRVVNPSSGNPRFEHPRSENPRFEKSTNKIQAVEG